MLNVGPEGGEGLEVDLWMVAGEVVGALRKDAVERGDLVWGVEVVVF